VQPILRGFAGRSAWATGSRRSTPAPATTAATGLGDGSRVAKDSARVAAYGTVDEANSAIGVVLAQRHPGRDPQLLTAVQHQLFDLGGELCIPGHAADPGRRHRAARAHLDGFNADLPPLKDFILPGGGAGRGALPPGAHHRPPRRARGGDAVAHEDVRPQAIRYLNRLSDLLFVLARVLARECGHGEVLWRRDLSVAERRLLLYTHEDCLRHDPGRATRSIPGACWRYSKPCAPLFRTRWTCAMRRGQPRGPGARP
jgi:cob(I)alamin adenosyltransferase